MPELPEVEIVARGLKRLEGQVLQAIDTFDKKVWFENEISEQLFEGLTLGRVYRHGKYLVLSLARDRHLLVHLRMTGKVLDINSSSIPVHLKKQWGKTKQIRFAIKFSREQICFWDTRRFGTITAVENLDLFWIRKKYAPDPLSETEAALKNFYTRLARAERPIKIALLDQSIAAGTGNIYADEALHRVKIHPQKVASQISLTKKEILFRALTTLFAEAIAAGGTTANNYLNALGIPGKFAEKLRVYGREGEKCLTCGRANIKRIVLGGRSTHFCPHCQRRT